ncbi:MAG: outer membrane lipoprotein-sorting protein [Treponema sp.]|jgi:outer membrane lipoprotein-sorting protein|nr:outer membrane lipoprotein-sorting protein [Treponema sp.]
MMKALVWTVLFTVMAGSFVYGQTPSAAELLRRVDDNEIYTTIEYEGDMIIEYQNKRFVKTMNFWGRGNSDSFVEFINPGDRGTKYLKKGGRLYVYSPDTEEVMLISGHMLKESMMGSDMSYEDTIENETLSARYDPAIGGSADWIMNGASRDCWILDLTAKKRTESYPKQKLWIDKETGDCLHYELFALSGAKLKEYNLVRVEVFGGRRFPVEIEIRDLLRKNSKTTLVMRNVILDRPIPDSVFSQRNLER